MALPAAGQPISFGDINDELGNSTTATLDLKDASEDYLAINPVVTEMLKDSPESLRSEIITSLMDVFSEYHKDNGLLFPSATWLVTANK